jgi:hypothetical protein
VFVYAWPSKPDPQDCIRQTPTPPAPPVWYSASLTATAGHSLSKQFTVPGEKLYSDRPLALLAVLGDAEKPGKNGGNPSANLDSPWHPWALMYWSQPLLLDHRLATDAPPAKKSSAQPLSLGDATTRLENGKWQPVACVGIPKEAQGFSITRYPECTRVDLKSDSKVYVSYQEFAVNPAGRAYSSGQLVRLAGAPGSVFRWESYVSLDCAHYVDLVGFAGNRMFTIHARQLPDATEDELAVALRVAALATKTTRP